MDGFLHRVRDCSHRNGALLMLDEMITGFRWHLNGAQKYYGIVPDLSTFGKALGNGFSVSALVGKRALMERGGLLHDQERVFLLSTTHGAEGHCLAAAIEVMRVYEREGIVERLWRQGERLATGVRRVACEAGVEEHFEVLGRPCNLVYVARDPDKRASQAYRTLFLQETLKRGLLMPSMVVSAAHQDADIDRTIEEVGEALRVYRKALEDGVERWLNGRPVKPVMRRMN
jgi:glutamate-1-semialdehyde 2,1-aminomutase